MGPPHMGINPKRLGGSRTAVDGSLARADCRTEPWLTLSPSGEGGARETQEVSAIGSDGELQCHRTTLRWIAPIASRS
jgi:hypothetical protein